MFSKIYNRKISVSSTVRIKKMEDLPTGLNWPVLGTLPSLIRAGGATKLHEYINMRHKQFGYIFKEKLGPIQAVFLSDPVEIQKVFSNEGKYPVHVLPEPWLLYNKVYNFQRGLYFMNGEEWLHYRKILNPVMFKQEFERKAEYLCNNLVPKLYNDWICESKNGEIVVLQDKLYNLSITFMVAYLLGSPFNSSAEIFISDITKMSDVVQDIFEYSVQLSVISSTLALKLRLPAWKKFVQSIHSSAAIASDLLQNIITLRGDGIVNDLLCQNMPINVIFQLIVDFIIAAGDTTANTMQWTLYLLGKNPDIQDKLFENLSQCKTIVEVALLRNVLKESMRLYPVAPFITRYLPEDIELCNYLIPANQLISMSMYTTSRNDEYFPEGEKFIPSRWDRSTVNEYKNVKNPFASLPYALGTRSCIGRKLAFSQLMFSIAKMVSLYRIETLEDVDVKLNLITLPSKPIKLRLSKRF